jgi:hypothetical protein
MIKFVKSRPLKKINRHSISERKTNISFFSIKKIPTKLIRITILLLLWIYAVILAFQKTAFSPEYTIKTIKYNTSDIQNFSNTWLYNQISNLLKKENFYVSRLVKNSILAEIKKQYPIVSNLEISMLWENTIYVDLDFQEPDLILRLQNKKFWVYGSTIIELSSGSKLSVWKENLFLPEYLSGTKALSGFFYKIDPKTLIAQIKTIHSLLPNLQQITYLPWWEKTIVYMPKWQILYFNNTVDITEQVKYFNLLKSYYTDFAKVKEVDLGSSGKYKIVVKKR